jgi:transglutaminase-like putative cysteine protease
MKRSLVSCAAGLAVSSLAAASLLHAAPVAPLTDAPQTLTTTFTTTATVSAPPAGTHVVNLWIPIPSNSAWQTVTDLHVTAPVKYQITRDQTYDDHMVYLHDVHPRGPLTVIVRYTVRRHAVRVLDPAGPVRQDTNLLPKLTADANVGVGGQFQTIADQVTQGDATDLAKERAVFNNVVSTMTYDYNHHSPEYAQGNSWFVCNYKDGNCSDLHSYVVSLSRSLGIPAVIDFGFPLTGIPTPAALPVDGAIPGYHCWVWFQTPHHGWVPLDAADARRWQDSHRPDVKNFLFGNLVLERTAVAVSRGRDIVLSPPQQGKPLNYFIYPYAEADGKPLTSTWKLRYHLKS